jgi:hypothetical protein
VLVNLSNEYDFECLNLLITNTLFWYGIITNTFLLDEKNKQVW